ncbi:MAG: T9SS type A sorting domain-containing protein [Candidatus Eisenbacteria bacterium]|nr:T9SS type A sorting domain-containing protein [Candidatus Eisenbacteria bacterium]
MSVTATSTTESSTETVVLPGAGGIYQGSLPLTLAMAAGGDGLLSVTEGDEIVVTYNDANPVTTLTATAVVDLTGPTITNVRATAITESDATINWTSSTVGDSKVYYGPTPALGLETGVDPIMVSSHAVALSGLLPGTLYYYDVETADGAGNAVRDDNGGMHYTFTADRNRDVLLVIGDSTFDKKVRYTNAFARIGWTYTIWEGASAATPYVGDLVSGMASFKAVVWQTGLEQYPMLTDAARDSVARLNDLGSRFAIFSHDVAWDFCDPTSPDYTVARCDWFKNELHSVWQSDPASFSQVRGIASDPISGGYTAGVSYTPHRSGAAGDEIDGLAIGGSFAYVWRDNDTSVDDIALRFTTSGPVGDPLHAVWGGTPEKISSNFFEWAHLNNTQADDAVRADILDKTLTWLVGRDNPIVDLTAPAGGEVFTDNSISISWTESAGAGYSIAARRLYYSDNSGESWTLITAAPGTSPYTWDISSVPNGIQYRVRVVIEDNGAPVLSAAEACASNFTINRAGGDTRGPLMVGGSMFISPNPVLKVSPYQTTLTGTTSDVSMGNSNIVAIEWSNGPTAAPPGGAGAHLLTAPGVSPVATLSTVIDNRVLAAGNETIWMRGKDAAGNWGPASPLAVVVNANPSSAEEIIPTRFALHVNAPNPFNPVTTIRYDLPKSSAVNLSIYDVTGRRVRTLVEGTLTPGSRSATWDGRDAGGNEATSGVYFYRIEAGDWNDTKKMTLLK